jgi:hypothetical protein
MYTCRICERTFPEIPSNAILISDRYGHLLYRFPDERLVHDLQRVEEEILEVKEST